MATINPGDMVRITGSFTNAVGAPADPTTVTLRVRPRTTGATETVYVYGTDVALMKDSVGEYHLDYLVPANLVPAGYGLGAIAYEWQGTGAVAAVEQGSFAVIDEY